MDVYKKQTIRKRIDKTIENLKRNNMDALFVESAAEVPTIVAGLLKQGDTVAWGGSVTLRETGVFELLRQGGYHLLDRDKPGLSAEEIRNVFLDSFRADAYLCSTNAVTENGELYNVDGNSNRVAALLFGPKSVIVVAGVNKIVRDLDEAAERVKSIAAPANAARLGCATPCVKTGRCADCKSEQRICCNTVICAQQRFKGRMKVLLVGEELGY